MGQHVVIQVWIAAAFRSLARFAGRCNVQSIAPNRRQHVRGDTCTPVSCLMIRREARRVQRFVRKPCARGPWRRAASMRTSCSGGQPRLAPGAPGRPQRSRPPALAPRAVPSHDALAADVQAPCDRPLRLATRGKQPRGLLPTNFQSVEIPSWGNMSRHVFHRTMEEGVQMSLYYARFSKFSRHWRLSFQTVHDLPD